ncbi:tryptophan 2-monooxygenase [Dulcicalothrix desertica PCC 7102]|uniref:Tryptophan 2-monooxygenase n=1 Tax=Dulcicalothrix desertica PCC 7102 TaxID=232991 RepID=A0A433UMB0_9CYAN|nr:FAD-dependent oxidoreductase [Dulcicalothrix desertica]RUS94965.1 tryptophan 2-monooxygenase [Dulcicalothrix desertica PCC 7102]TWH62800.1 tryptophan 2-monooxygenase precursor [Dulcicalothrix desertica PCC 7102]
MSIYKNFNTIGAASEASEFNGSSWQFSFPNTADFNFNYYKLLEFAQGNAIAQNNNPNARIAIIGAGVAGLLAARELFRSGYTNIDIYEASNRIGGRLYSIPAPNQYTTFEMGAMRMPFFIEPGSGNCVLDYYCTLFGITTQPFPNPGSEAIASTGIYINNGNGPDSKNEYLEPRLDIWLKNEQPPNPLLQIIHSKWTHFADMLIREAKKLYNTDLWEVFWHRLVNYYGAMSFQDLVYKDAISEYDSSIPGYFGGLGMTEQEAWNFDVIGAGDGGWGAFYDISCLYPIRTLLFGFATNHQLIQGKFDHDGNFAPGQQWNQPTKDNLGNQLESPHYLGVQSLPESLFYEPVTSPFVDNISLYQATQLYPGINLYTSNKVNTIEYLGKNSIQIVSDNITSHYNAVIVTVPTWALEMGCVFKNFDSTMLAPSVSLSIKKSHWITSCKVFYPLKQRYWEQPNLNPNNDPIPQVISTDTFIRDVYGLAVTTKSHNDPGVLLVSYTWEDDTVKLQAYQDDATLAEKCLLELDNILTNSKNIQMPISPYVDTSKPVVIHWERQPTYHGCAKLYRKRSWNLDYPLLTYNQQHSAASGIYFAGEAYSVEGGWTEPALRQALDAVIHIVKNTNGTFLNGFDYDANYPQYPQWAPSYKNLD